MTLHFDNTTHTTVIVCHCGWRTLTTTKTRATTEADQHQKNTHPTDQRMIRQLEQRRHRA